LLKRSIAKNMKDPIKGTKEITIVAIPNHAAATLQLGK
jgi:hypothetical protein